VAQKRADRIGSRRSPLQGDLPCGALRSLQRSAWFQESGTVAVGHSILVICYHVLERGVPYEELGEDYFERRRSSEAYAKRLVRQLERLGHRVELEPLPRSA
jgi:hypothetical protein